MFENVAIVDWLTYNMLYKVVKWSENNVCNIIIN